MILNGLDAEPKLPGYFSVHLALKNQVEDLALTASEATNSFLCSLPTCEASMVLLAHIQCPADATPRRLSLNRFFQEVDCPVHFDCVWTDFAHVLVQAILDCHDLAPNELQAVFDAGETGNSGGSSSS